MVGDFKILVLKYETSDIISQSCGILISLILMPGFSGQKYTKCFFFAPKKPVTMKLI